MVIYLLSEVATLSTLDLDLFYVFQTSVCGLSSAGWAILYLIPEIYTSYSHSHWVALAEACTLDTTRIKLELTANGNGPWAPTMGDGKRYQRAGGHTHTDYLLIDCSKLFRLNLIGALYAKGFICAPM